MEKQSNKVIDYPNPDLVIEVDISPSRIDRPGIYGVLQVPELWRLRDRMVSIEQLVSSGVFVAMERSRFLPVRNDEVTRWVFTEYSRDPTTWSSASRVGSNRPLESLVGYLSFDPGAANGIQKTGYERMSWRP